MSDWRDLGTVPVREGWAVFPGIAFGTNLFRLTQTFNQEWRPWNAKLLISASFELSNFQYRYKTRAYTPDLEARAIIWPVPQELEDRGWIARYFFVKHSFYSRVSAETNWRVKLEEYLK